jgi:hypothetical protein
VWGAVYNSGAVLSVEWLRHVFLQLRGKIQTSQGIQYVEIALLERVKEIPQIYHCDLGSNRLYTNIYGKVRVCLG